MKVLYYCKTINSSHGGRTHAREFYAALKKVVGADSVHSYYELEDINDENISSENRHLRLWWLPFKLRTFLRLLIVNKNHTQEICKKLNEKECDVLLLRHETIRIDYKYIKENHPNIKIAVELNTIFANESFSNYIAKKIIHNIEFKQFATVDKIFPVSSTLKQALIIGGISANKITTNPNGVDLDRFNPGLMEDKIRFRNLYRIPTDKFVVGYVGGMEPYRRLPEFINQYLSIEKNIGEKLHLFVVGDGHDFTAIENKLKEGLDRGKFTLLGWQDHSDVPKIMATFDLSIMPYTLDYCSPLKLFEYLAMKLPTIGPDTISVHELFEDGVDLFINKLGDSNNGGSIADQICLLVEDTDKRVFIANNGYKKVVEGLTWEANALRVVESIKDSGSC